MMTSWVLACMRVIMCPLSINVRIGRVNQWAYIGCALPLSHSISRLSARKVEGTRVCECDRQQTPTARQQLKLCGCEVAKNFSISFKPTNDAERGERADALANLTNQPTP